MRKRSVLLLSAFAATLSFHSLAQEPAADAKGEAKGEAKKPADAKPAPPKPATAPAPAPAAAPAPVEAAPLPAADAPPPAAQGTEQPELAPEAGTLPQAQPGLTPLPVWPEPSEDAAALKRQGAERPGNKPKPGSAVFAEDWWTHTRPILEWHGSFRARGELFYKFHLGRNDPASSALFPRPADHYYTPRLNSNLLVPAGSQSCTSTPTGTSRCDDNTNAGANLRFRL